MADENITYTTLGTFESINNDQNKSPVVFQTLGAIFNQDSEK
jgi:hypothetical protein